MIDTYFEVADIIKDFIWKVERELMTNHYCFPPENHSAGIDALHSFERYLKEEGLVFTRKEAIRTIPSCEEEAISLYGYDPKTKKYPWEVKHGKTNKGNSNTKRERSKPIPKKDASRGEKTRNNKTRKSNSR